MSQTIPVEKEVNLDSNQIYNLLLVFASKQVKTACVIACVMCFYKPLESSS